MDTPDTLDELLELKRLNTNAGFKILVQAFDDEIARLENKIFARRTSDSEARDLRYEVMALKNMHPTLIIERTGEQIETRIEKANAEQGFPSR